LLNRDKAKNQNFLVYLNLTLAKDSIVRFIILSALIVSVILILWIIKCDYL